jgi:hypothetical protein
VPGVGIEFFDLCFGVSKELFDCGIPGLEKSAKEIIGLIRDVEFYQQLWVRRFRDECQILKVEHLPSESQHNRLQVVEGIRRWIALSDPPERVSLANNHSLRS